MKKKRLIRVVTCIALLLSSLPLTAETIVTLVLTQNDGTVSHFSLSGAPVITYSGDEIIVTSGEQSLSTLLEGLKITFGEEEVTTSIENTQDREEGFQPQFSFGQAVFEGLQAGATVVVYTTDGKAVSRVKADGDGRVTVSLDNLPKGVYILRTPVRSYKIKK